jgi:uncharacterized protein DUF222/HNH endonuclease
MLRESVASVRASVASFDADRVPNDDVGEIVELFSELERLAIAGRTLIARRVERSNVWCNQGFNTPARWMAAKAQTTLASAIATFNTGRKLAELPATEDALRAGSLSRIQAAEITAAASADPGSESRLLRAARTDTVAQLREQCAQVVAAASRDRQADERVHRSRYLRSWSDTDGAFRLDARLTGDAGARLMSTVDARSREFQEQARRAGSKDRAEAHAADALVSLADTTTPGPRAVVHVHVDADAWERGHAETGESCSVPGVGPIPVAAARRLARDGVVKAVLDDDADVRAISRLGRAIPAKLRSALEARDATCVVPGCDESEALEIDHVVPHSEGGPTRLDNLARLCRWHHSLKTYRGWGLRGRPGAWEWLKLPRKPIPPQLN